MNELFIEPSPNYSWSIWFIYNPICFIDIVVVISPMLPFFDISYIVSFFPSDGKSMGIYCNVVQQKDKKLIILTIITLDNMLISDYNVSKYVSKLVENSIYLDIGWWVWHFFEYPVLNANPSWS